MIDPFVLARFVGGSGTDRALAVKVDQDSCIEIAGSTTSTGISYGTGVYDTTLGGTQDGFVSRFAPDSGLLFTTYLGGSSGDVITALGLQSNGDIVAAGYTYSTDFPAYVYGVCGTFPHTHSCNKAFQATLAGNSDAFVSILSPSGSSLPYSTYLGGSQYDEILGLAIDDADNIYVAGDVFSSVSGTETGFPTTSNGYQQFSALSRVGSYDIAFLGRFSSGLTSLDYSTYLAPVSDHGGTYPDAGSTGYFNSGINPVAIVPGSGSRKVAVAGWTNSNEFPVYHAAQPSRGTFHPLAGTQTGFVAELDTAQSNTASLIYSTYLGGKTGVVYGGDPSTYYSFKYVDGTGQPYDATDRPWGVVVDSSGNAYVAGYTNGQDFPIAPASSSGAKGSARTVYRSGLNKGFISKLSSDGTKFLAGTLYGGSLTDEIAAIALDSSNNVVVAGTTNSGDNSFPAIGTDSPAQKTDDSVTDAFVARLNADLSLVSYSNRLTGTKAGVGQDVYVGGLALDSSGNVYVAGDTQATSFGGSTTAAAGSNAYLAKVVMAPVSTAVSWRGDFTTNDLTQWQSILCGGYGNPPSGGAGVNICPLTKEGLAYYNYEWDPFPDAGGESLHALPGSERVYTAVFLAKRDESSRVIARLAAAASQSRRLSYDFESSL